METIGCDRSKHWVSSQAELREGGSLIPVRRGLFSRYRLGGRVRCHCWRCRRQFGLPAALQSALYNGLRRWRGVVDVCCVVVAVVRNSTAWQVGSQAQRVGSDISALGS